MSSARSWSWSGQSEANHRAEQSEKTQQLRVQAQHGLPICSATICWLKPVPSMFRSPNHLTNLFSTLVGRWVHNSSPMPVCIHVNGDNTLWAWEVPDLMDTTPFDIKTCLPTTQRESYLEQFEFCSQTLSESVRSVLLPCRLLKWVQQASEQTVFPGNCRAPSPFYSAAAVYKGTVWLQDCRRGIHSMTKFIIAEKQWNTAESYSICLEKQNKKPCLALEWKEISMKEIRH